MFPFTSGYITLIPHPSICKRIILLQHYECVSGREEENGSSILHVLFSLGFLCKEKRNNWGFFNDNVMLIKICISLTSLNVTVV